MGIFKKMPNKIALNANKIVSDIWLLKDNNAFLRSPPPSDLETILPPQYQWTFQLMKKEMILEKQQI